MRGKEAMREDGRDEMWWKTEENADEQENGSREEGKEEKRDEKTKEKREKTEL